jgi:hypothetical protein
LAAKVAEHRLLCLAGSSLVCRHTTPLSGLECLAIFGGYY